MCDYAQCSGRVALRDATSDPADAVETLSSRGHVSSLGIEALLLGSANKTNTKSKQNIITATQAVMATTYKSERAAGGYSFLLASSATPEASSRE